MWQDVVKLGSDTVASVPGTGWVWQQWYMAVFFVFMAGQFAWAVYENKWPKARPSHIVFLILMLVSSTVLWTSGFWK